MREPINSPNPLAVALIAHKAPNGAEAVWAEYYKIIAEQKQERLQLLAENLDVDLLQPDGWALLALRLAERFVPGLQVAKCPQKKAGRPHSSGDAGGVALLLAIEGRILKGETVANACHNLSKRAGPWNKKKWKSLETRYYESKKEFEYFKSTPSVSPLCERLEKAAGRKRTTTAEPACGSD